jgi:hypothetical protein
MDRFVDEHGLVVAIGAGVEVRPGDIGVVLVVDAAVGAGISSVKMVAWPGRPSRSRLEPRSW